MELGVFDRLILLNILPKEGDFTTLKIIRELRETLSFTEAENKALKFCEPAPCEKCGKEIDIPWGKPAPLCSCGGKLIRLGNIKWQTEADKPKEIKIGEKATDVIVGVLKDLNDKKKLTDQHFSLYEKFIK